MTTKWDFLFFFLYFSCKIRTQKQKPRQIQFKMKWNWEKRERKSKKKTNILNWNYNLWTLLHIIYWVYGGIYSSHSVKNAMASTITTTTRRTPTWNHNKYQILFIYVVVVAYTRITAKATTYACIMVLEHQQQIQEYNGLWWFDWLVGSLFVGSGVEGGVGTTLQNGTKIYNKSKKRKGRMEKRIQVVHVK